MKAPAEARQTQGRIRYGSEITNGKVVCAWCGKELGEKELAEGKDAVTHGICAECEEKMLKGEKKNSGSAAPEARRQNGVTRYGSLANADDGKRYRLRDEGSGVFSIYERGTNARVFTGTEPEARAKFEALLPGNRDKKEEVR